MTILISLRLHTGCRGIFTTVLEFLHWAGDFWLPEREFPGSWPWSIILFWSHFA